MATTDRGAGPSFDVPPMRTMLQEGHTLIDDPLAFRCSQTDPGDMPGGGDID